MSDWREALKDRLAGLRLRPEREAEIIDELSQHLDDQVQELVAGGADVETARATALAELDAPGALARRLAAIDQRPPLVLPPPGMPSRGRFLQAGWQDIRHSLRALRRAPIFTLTVLVTFALTIGPTTAIISIGNWLLWRPAPGVHEPQRLAVIWVGQWREQAGSIGVSPSGVSYLNLQDLREASKTLTGIAGIQEGSATIAAENVTPANGGAGWVTANAFDVLGVPIIAGRPFRQEDDREPGGEPVALVSETLARRAFGDAAGAVNQRLELNGQALTIVGVLPEQFAGITPMSRVSVWYPGATYGYVNHFTGARTVSRTDGVFYSFVARLAPGATFESAQAELDALVPTLAKKFPDDNEKFRTARARLFPGLGPRELQRKRYADNVRVLLAIGAALLLLGCANVANVLMVRSVRTGRDRAIRLALGASRVRLVMSQLTEGGLLAVGGAILGLLLAVWLKQLIVSLLFPAAPVGQEIQVPLDLRVLGLTLGVSIACALLAGLVPALLQRRFGVAASIAAGAGRSVTGLQWLRSGFAGAQLALSVALVTGSLLLAATLRNLYAVDLGFDPEGVSRHFVDPARHGYRQDRATRYFQDMLERLRHRPGLASVSISGRYPFGSGWRIDVQDPAAANPKPFQVMSNNVSAGYFDVLRMPFVSGRAFTDTEAMTPVGSATVPVVVSESLARRLFSGATAVGRTFVLPKSGNAPERDAVVVGVTRDLKWRSFTDAPPLFVYQPLSQYPRGDVVLVRSALPLPQVARIIDDVAREIDSTMPVSSSQFLVRDIEGVVSEQRTFAWVLSLVGWIAFALAAVGLYGLLAQSVSERTREFGIRLAIGSGRRRIFAIVLRQAAWIGLVGGIAGLALAAFGTRLIETQLFGVTRLDVTTYVLAATALVLVVFLAGLWPARSATRIEPVEALRVE
jgi:predicted permease